MVKCTVHQIWIKLFSFFILHDKPRQCLFLRPSILQFIKLGLQEVT